MTAGVITIGIDPTLHVGPVSLAWHGIMIALGLLAGGLLAAQYARKRGLDPERVLSLVTVVGLAGILGARILYLLENDAGALARPADWLGSKGFAFYGALIVGAIAAAWYVHRKRLSARYVDALAAGFPLGMAIGRIGDLISGEHFGPPSNLPWAVRYTSSNAEVPSPGVAYHSGGLYEVLLALAILALIWPLRKRLQRPTMLLWTVVGLYGIGRFFMFFYRSDSPASAFGINTAQWTSLAIVATAVVGAAIARSRLVAAAPG